MNMRELLPWSRRGSAVPSAFRDEQNPFLALHREMNRLFDEAFHGLDHPTSPFGSSFWGAGWPNVEIAETEKEIQVTAEVPGLEEKDVEILLEDGVLTLKGEKRTESRDKDNQFSECFYGHFERRLPLSAEVAEDRVSASFKNGLLRVTLPKTERAQSKVRRIEIAKN